jgi:hypothetical protein
MGIRARAGGRRTSSRSRARCVFLVIIVLICSSVVRGKVFVFFARRRWMILSCPLASRGGTSFTCHKSPWLSIRVFIHNDVIYYRQLVCCWHNTSASLPWRTNVFPTRAHIPSVCLFASLSDYSILAPSSTSRGACLADHPPTNSPTRNGAPCRWPSPGLVLSISSTGGLQLRWKHQTLLHFDRMLFTHTLTFLSIQLFTIPRDFSGMRVCRTKKRRKTRVEGCLTAWGAAKVVLLCNTKTVEINFA